MISSNEINQNNFDLGSFKISYDVGFMLENPLKTLPEYFRPWNTLAKELPALYKTKKVREAVLKLPLLDHKKLVGHRQLRLAHLQLSFITAGYVWQDGDKGAPKSIPENLAVPFHGITELLGIQPVLGHIDLALANWSLKNSSGPYDFENLECIYHIPGDFSGDWFCIIPFMVEFTFAKCLKDFVEIIKLLNVAGGSNPIKMSQSTLENKIALHLDEITKVISLMKKALSRTHDHLDAKVFFNQVRPFLAGWGGEGNPMPDGLVYEGVSATPIKMLGGSAAQSSTLQALDSLLGVEHVTDQKGFIVKMRSFMSPEHRRFIEYLENRKYSLRHLVQTAETDTLLSSYNNCLSALIQLRTYHIQIVSKYVVIVSKEMNEGNYQSLDTKGTGGTSLIPFLKDMREDTEVKIVSSKQTKKLSKFSQMSWLTIGALAVLGASVIFSAVTFLKK